MDNRKKQYQLAQKLAIPWINCIIVICVFFVMMIIYWIFFPAFEAEDPLGLKIVFLAFWIICTLLVSFVPTYIVLDTIAARKDDTLISLSKDRKKIIIHKLFGKKNIKDISCLEDAISFRPEDMPPPSLLGIIMGSHKSGGLLIKYRNDEGKLKEMPLGRVLNCEKAADNLLAIMHKNKKPKTGDFAERVWGNMKKR